MCFTSAVDGLTSQNISTPCPSTHPTVLLHLFYSVLVQELPCWSLSACNLSAEPTAHPIAWLTRVFTVSLSSSSACFHFPRSSVIYLLSYYLQHTRTFPISVLLFAWLPQAWMLVSFLSDWQTLIHPLFPNFTLLLHSWIESLPPWSSHNTLLLALESTYFTLYHHSLLQSFLPIRLYAPCGQEPTLVCHRAWRSQGQLGRVFVTREGRVQS